MFRKIYFAVIVMLFATKALYAMETGTIHGKVIDGFGKPITFANVTVASNGSKSKTTTDTTGVFSIGYNPGNIKLTFDKEGYVPLYIPLTLDENTDLSIGDLILWKIPHKGGLFIVGNDNYTEINNAEYYSEANSKERRFFVKGTPTVIKGPSLKIIDFQTDSPLVVGKTLYSVDSKSSLGCITFYPSQKYLLNREEDAYTKIADNIGMRKMNLPPGKYFYCTGEITTRSKIGFGFFFEVSS